MPENSSSYLRPTHQPTLMEPSISQKPTLPPPSNTSQHISTDLPQTPFTQSQQHQQQQNITNCPQKTQQQKNNLMEASNFRTQKRVQRTISNKKQQQCGGVTRQRPGICGKMKLGQQQQQLSSGDVAQFNLHTHLLASKLPSHCLSRTSLMNPQLSGLVQNGQTGMVHNSMSQQLQLKQMRTVTTADSPSVCFQQQQKLQILQQNQLAAFSQLQQFSVKLSTQQVSHLAQKQQPIVPLKIQQKQQPVVPPKIQQHQQPQQHQPSEQLLNQEHQFPSMEGSYGQKSLGLTGSQPDVTTSGSTTPGRSSGLKTEASKQLLGKRKIQDLVSQVDPLGKLDPEVEALLLEFADDFIDSVTTFACSLAKHRKSSTLELKDVLLHLEKNCGSSVPGFSSEEGKFLQNCTSSDHDNKRLNTICSLMDPSCTDASGELC